MYGLSSCWYYRTVLFRIFTRGGFWVNYNTVTDRQTDIKYYKHVKFICLFM